MSPASRRVSTGFLRGAAIGIAALLLPTLGCDSPHDAPLWQPPAGAHAYDVTVTLSVEGLKADEIPKTFDLHIYASPSTPQLLIWDGSRLRQPDVVAESDTRLTTKDFSAFVDIPRWTSHVAFFYLAMTVDVRPDGLSGTLEGRASVLHGDVGNGLIPVQGTLTGTLDRQAPSLVGAGPGSRYHPFEPVVLSASEPLAPDVALDLHGDDGQIIPFEANPESDFPVGLTAAGMLRFGQRYQVVARTPIRDLAGNVSTQPLPVVETMPDPGWFDDPGFEGQARGIYERCRVGPLGITGLRALWMGRGRDCDFYQHPCEYSPPSRFTARVRVPAGASMVRFSWRALENAVLEDDTSVSLVAPGGGVSGAAFGKVAADEAFTPLDDGTLASTAREVAVPLPADTTDELVVVITPGSITQDSRWFGLQIDDLRVE